MASIPDVTQGSDAERLESETPQAAFLKSVGKRVATRTVPRAVPRRVIKQENHCHDRQGRKQSPEEGVEQ